jgi:hypothetical protein
MIWGQDNSGLSHVKWRHSARTKLQQGPGPQLVRQINRRAKAVIAHGINKLVHWLLGHSRIPGKEEADRDVNIDCNAGGGLGDQLAVDPGLESGQADLGGKVCWQCGVRNRLMQQSHLLHSPVQGRGQAIGPKDKC